MPDQTASGTPARLRRASGNPAQHQRPHSSQKGISVTRRHKTMLSAVVSRASTALPSRGPACVADHSELPGLLESPAEKSWRIGPSRTSWRRRRGQSLAHYEDCTDRILGEGKTGHVAVLPEILTVAEASRGLKPRMVRPVRACYISPPVNIVDNLNAEVGCVRNSASFPKSDAAHLRSVRRICRSIEGHQTQPSAFIKCAGLQNRKCGLIASLTRAGPTTSILRDDRLSTSRLDITSPAPWGLSQRNSRILASSSPNTSRPTLHQ